MERFDREAVRLSVKEIDMKPLERIGFAVFGALVVLVILFLIGGCEDTGRVGPSKSAVSIYGADDGVSKGYFIYVDMFDSYIEQEGVRMDVTGGDSASYLSNNGLGGLTSTQCDYAQHIESRGITDENGIVATRGHRDDWDSPKGYVVRSSMTLSKPNSPGTNAKFSYSTKSSDELLQVAKATADKTANINVASLNTNMLSQPAYLDGGEFIPSILTDEEYDLVTSATTGAPSHGFEMVSCDLVSLKGKLGHGSCVRTSSIMPINLTDPNDYMRYAGPFCYRYVVKTAEPADIKDRSFNGRVKTDACPGGVPVEIRLIESNEDMKTHIFGTEVFLPVDCALSVADMEAVSVYDRWSCYEEPNVFDANQFVMVVRDDWLDCVDPNLYSDPNTCPDPNVLFDPGNLNMYNITCRLDTTVEAFEDLLIEERVRRVKIVPMAPEDDYVRIGFDGNMFQFLDAWLTDEKNLDMTGDGIVNLKDIMY